MKRASAVLSSVLMLVVSSSSFAGFTGPSVPVNNILRADNNILRADEHSFVRAADPKIQPLVDDAKPFLAEAIPQLACASPDIYQMSPIFKYFDSGVPLNEIVPPQKSLHANKSNCLNIVRIDAFKRETSTRLSFVATFESPDSNEVTKRYLKAIKQPDGKWLLGQ